MPVDDRPQELHGRKLALVFSGLMLVMLMAALDSTIVATALPTIAGDLGGPESHLVGDHRLPARPDRGHAALREIGRPVRTPHRPPGRARHLPDRLGPLRDKPELPRADRVPSVPGSGRGRSDGECPGGDRRRGAAPSTRSVPGPVRCRFRCGHGDRAPTRRDVDHQPLVALDLLHQPAHRSAGAGGVGPHIPVGGHPHPAPDRLPRCRPAGPLPGVPGAPGELGRHHLSLGLHPG